MIIDSGDPFIDQPGKNRQLLLPGGIYYYTERQRELAEETKDNGRTTGEVWKISL